MGDATTRIAGSASGTPAPAQSRAPSTASSTPSFDNVPCRRPSPGSTRTTPCCPTGRPTVSRTRPTRCGRCAATSTRPVAYPTPRSRSSPCKWIWRWRTGRSRSLSPSRRAGTSCTPTHRCGPVRPFSVCSAWSPATSHRSAIACAPLTIGSARFRRSWPKCQPSSAPRRPTGPTAPGVSARQRRRCSAMPFRRGSLGWPLRMLAAWLASTWPRGSPHHPPPRRRS